MKKIFNFKMFSILLALLTWQVFALIIAKPIIIPTIGQVILSIQSLLVDKLFYLNFSYTLGRIFISFIFNLIFALILGTISYFYPKFEILFHPWESMLRSIPTMALIIASLIWFTSEYTPLFVASVLVLPMMYRTIVNALKNMNKETLEMIELYKVPQNKRIFRVYLPSIIPELKTVSRSSIGLLFKIMITAEVLSQPKYGIGAQFQIARAVLDTPMVFAISIIVILSAFLVEAFSDYIYTRGNNGYYM